MKKIILLLTLAITGLFNATQAQMMTCTVTLNVTTSGSTISGYASFNNGTAPTSGTVSFDMGDGTTINTGNQFSYTYLNNGTYTVCANVSDSTNQLWCSNCATVVIGNSTSNCTTNFTATPDTSILNGVYFSITNTGTAPYTYSFDYGDNTTGTSLSHSYPDTSYYSACVTATDANGCVSNYCTYVSGNNSGNTSNCQTYIGLSNSGSTVSGYAYGNGTPNSTSYTWDFGDGSSGTGSQFSHVYSQPGFYTICVTASDFLSGCNTYACDTISVTNSSTGSCSNTFTGLVAGNTVTLNATATGGTGPYTLTWDYGDNSTGTNTTHTYASAGSYIVCLTSADANGCVANSCNYVTIGNSGNTCQAYFWMYPDTANGTPNGVWYGFDASNSAGATSANTFYTWDFGDGTTSNQQYPAHTYVTPGTYVICLTLVTSSNLGTTCTSSYCDSSSVIRIASGTTMNSITILPGTTSVKNIDSFKNISASPNPSNGSAALNITGAANSNLKVYDMLGNLVSSNKCAAANYQLDISSLNAGTYILTINDNNTVVNKKFVVTK